jgi:hypothetical protein
MSWWDGVGALKSIAITLYILRLNSPIMHVEGSILFIHSLRFCEGSKSCLRTRILEMTLCCWPFLIPILKLMVVNLFFQGSVPLISARGLHQLRIFKFFLAVFHVVYSVITMLLRRMKVEGVHIGQVSIMVLSFYFFEV